ncbi:hypothetical protein [Cellulomonas sp. KRMCY2]|uniref:hypothetical protein n=1 Tax=Cellulomonas sp. KRMCY2 TaxID=1304865 RepID=UPI00045EB218|nr:hypothetical protein [Cellulomonas sp. KRMCY2]
MRTPDRCAHVRRRRARPTGARTADDAPRVGHSWLLGEIRPLTIVLAVAATVVLVVAGVTHLAGVGWWPWAVVVGAGVSALLMVLTFTPWWLIGLGMDAALIVWALRAID